MARNYLEKRALQAVVEDEVVGYMYTPQPFPLQNVELPSDVLNSATVVEPLVGRLLLAGALLISIDRWANRDVMAQSV